MPEICKQTVINKQSLTPAQPNNRIMSFLDAQLGYCITLTIILIVYSLAQILLLASWPLSYNDGVSLQVSRLITWGHQPYTQIFTPANPLFVWLVGGLGQFNLSPIGFKFFFLLFGLLLLINTALIARTLLGRKVALATVFVLGTAATFLAEAASSIAAVTPAVSVALLSLIFTLHYRRAKQWVWLFLGGIAWGIALFFDLSALSIGLTTVGFLFFFQADSLNADAPSANWKLFLKATGVWLAGALITVSAGIVLASPDIIFGHILQDYITLRNNLPLNLNDNFIRIGQFLTYNLWLFLLAIYGLARIYNEVDHPLWVILIWAMLSLCWLMLQVTLLLVDVTILLPPLALMAGWGLVDAISRFMAWARQRRINNRGKRNVLYAGITLFLLSFYFWTTGQLVARFNLRDFSNEDELAQLEHRPEIISFIHRHTGPRDCVIIDDAALAVAANRWPAPPLVALTENRIAGGLITEETIAALTQKHSCKAVVFSKRKYTQPLSNFKDWVGKNYPNHLEFPRTDIYYQ